MEGGRWLANNVMIVADLEEVVERINKRKNFMAILVRSNFKGRLLEVRIPNVHIRGKEVYLNVLDASPTSIMQRGMPMRIFREDCPNEE